MYNILDIKNNYYGYSARYNICLNNKTDYLIVNFWDSYLNYGALLTAFAIQELLKNFGYSSKLLDAGQRTNCDWYQGSFVENFAKKYLDITNKLNFSQCQKLSKKIKGVILGSDQILRLEYITYNLDKYLLNWADKNCRKIALSASFGIDINEFLSCRQYTKKIAKQMQNALQSFDYLSCREISGKKIFKNVFSLDSDHIIDPVFLIEKEKFVRIANDSSINNSDKIVSYVLDYNSEYDKLYKYLSEKENTEIIPINNKGYLVEDWLKSIKDCRLVITDSFHGVCFALIFNKKFICIRNKNRGDARFQSLIDFLNLENNFAYSINEVCQDKFTYDVDYKRINKKIKEKQISDLKIIDKVLNKNYSNNPNAFTNKIRNKKFFHYENRMKTLTRLKLKTNYYRCRFLANLTFKERKQHYIAKKQYIKNELKKEVAKW